MITWIQRTTRRARRNQRPAPAKEHFARPVVESLEDRITPARLPAITAVLDPAAAVRVDQTSYTITGTLRKVAGTTAAVYAYFDSNGNGVYDPGVDALAGVAMVGKKSST